ncbi:MAG: diaminopimelate epimerase [Hyphomicrobiales bacterium]|nr:diaminopimelate epimerase [Hyphomicrobiales bacterium]
MNGLDNRPFLKMNGIGNSIIVLDLRGTGIAVRGEDARAIGRAQGLHYDQLMVVHDPLRPDADARMKIFNIDGSLSGACGNGTRCVAWAMLRDRSETRLMLESDAGMLECIRVGDRRFSVDMGSPRLDWKDIPLRGEGGDTLEVILPDPPVAATDLPSFSAVNMGNPHAIFFVGDPDRYDLAATGSAVENHPLFPERVNTSLVRVDNRAHLTARVWERGAGATLACGSAACAIVVAAARRGLTGRKAVVSLPGGDLEIEWRESDGHVIMTGDVELEFEGRLNPDIFAAAPA